MCSRRREVGAHSRSLMNLDGSAQGPHHRSALYAATTQSLASRARASATSLSWRAPTTTVRSETDSGRNPSSSQAGPATLHAHNDAMSNSRKPLESRSVEAELCFASLIYSENFNFADFCSSSIRGLCRCQRFRLVYGGYASRRR